MLQLWKPIWPNQQARKKVKRREETKQREKFGFETGRGENVLNTNAKKKKRKNEMDRRREGKGRRVVHGKDETKMKEVNLLETLWENLRLQKQQTTKTQKSQWNKKKLSLFLGFLFHSSQSFMNHLSWMVESGMIRIQPSPTRFQWHDLPFAPSLFICVILPCSWFVLTCGWGFWWRLLFILRGFDGTNISMVICIKSGGKSRSGSSGCMGGTRRGRRSCSFSRKHSGRTAVLLNRVGNRSRRRWWW